MTLLASLLFMNSLQALQNVLYGLVVGNTSSNTIYPPDRFNLSGQCEQLISYLLSQICKNKYG